MNKKTGLLMIIDGMVILEGDLKKPECIEFMEKYICKEESVEEELVVSTEDYRNTFISEDDADIFEKRAKVYEKFLGLGYSMEEVSKGELHCGLDAKKLGLYLEKVVIS